MRAAPIEPREDLRCRPRAARAYKGTSWGWQSAAPPTARAERPKETYETP